MKIPKAKITKKVIILIGVLCFFLLFLTAGVSYSDNAQMCLLCHSMNQAYETLQENPDHKDIKCGKCHAPDTYISKVSFKFTSGLRDLYSTAIGVNAADIEVTEKSREIINTNCYNCHQSIINISHQGRQGNCTDCHRGVPHKGI